MLVRVTREIKTKVVHLVIWILMIKLWLYTLKCRLSVYGKRVRGKSKSDEQQKETTNKLRLKLCQAQVQLKSQC